jgi:hypothetical protein
MQYNVSNQDDFIKLKVVTLLAVGWDNLTVVRTVGSLVVKGNKLQIHATQIQV